MKTLGKYNEDCRLFQLISGGGSGSIDNADSSLVVQQACEYYRANQDFTFEHQSALRKLYPHLKTFKELTGLCKDDVRIQIGYQSDLSLEIAP